MAPEKTYFQIHNHKPTGPWSVSYSTFTGASYFIDPISRTVTFPKSGDLIRLNKAFVGAADVSKRPDNSFHIKHYNILEYEPLMDVFTFLFWITGRPNIGEKYYSILLSGKGKTVGVGFVGVFYRDNGKIT